MVYLNSFFARRMLPVAGVLVVLLGLLALVPAKAQTAATSAELDRLFGELLGAETPDEARLVEGEIWRQWLRSGSATVDLIMTRGLEALEAQEYAVALDMFSTAIELDPDFPEAWNKRATLYYVIDDYDAAIADVSQVLSREPRHWPALMGLAVMMEDLDRKAPALEAYRSALEINPQLEDAQAAVERLEVDVEGRGI